MTEYRYTLTFDSDFSIGTGAYNLSHTPTEQIISGATLRGAFAALWWRTSGGDPDSQRRFEDLFDRDFLVTQAVPEGAKLLPASAQVCKYKSAEGCAKVVVDDAVTYAVTGKENTDKLCRECGGPLTREAGWQCSGVTTQRHSRVKLTSNEVAEDGMLFSRDYVQVKADGDKGKKWAGHIITSHDLSWLQGQHIVVGQGGSLGKGRAQVTIEKEMTPPTDSAHREGCEYRAGYERGVALCLTSPAIITDKFGAPELSAEALTEELRRISGDALTVHAQGAWLRSELITGWHARSRLPKVPDWALAAGSSFVVSGLTEEGWCKLRRGIGWRTQEGYGQLEFVSQEFLPPAPISLERWQELSAQLRRNQKWWSTNKALLVGTIGDFSQGIKRDTSTVESAADRLANNGGWASGVKPYVATILSLAQSDLAELHSKLSSKEWR